MNKKKPNVYTINVANRDPLDLIVRDTAVLQGRYNGLFCKFRVISSRSRFMELKITFFGVGFRYNSFDLPLSFQRRQQKRDPFCLIHAKTATDNYYVLQKWMLSCWLDGHSDFAPWKLIATKNKFVGEFVPPPLLSLTHF